MNSTFFRKSLAWGIPWIIGSISGRFLVVDGANAVNILSFNADTGALTQVGPTYAVGDNLQTIAFATF